ncbi:unnamed protein product [Cunninghamella echinulata]
MTQPTNILEKRIVRVVFLALILDLLAFTIILPLFPRLLNFYEQQTIDKSSLLTILLHWLQEYKSFVSTTSGKKWDTVLLGGFIGSLFSFLQFIISPLLGYASDKYGRRKVLLFSMVGNIVSTYIWLIANTFTKFLLARMIAGISEGNIQLSIAIISDITSSENRSKNMALIGIAFATAFTFGPPFGAWLASKDLSQTWLSSWINNLYPYSMAALVALVLLIIETVYLFTYLPETAFDKNQQQKEPIISSPSKTTPLNNNNDKYENIKKIKQLNLIQGLFSFLFSGMEFTLVFLTFDVMDYSHMQQGKLLGYMGVLSALIQGGYVRRQGQKHGEKKLILQGIFFGSMGLSCLTLIGSDLFSSSSSSSRTYLLYLGVACLAMTSGTVVNSLTSLVSLYCHENEKGKILGVFRSCGQLGRALGPLSACSLYWLMGPTWCYGVGTLFMSLLLLLSKSLVPSSRLKLD